MQTPGGFPSFLLEIGGVEIGYFPEASELGSESEIIEQRLVGPDGQPIIRKVPGRLAWGDIVLKRGITQDLMLWKWRNLVEEGRIAEARRNGSVTMVNSDLIPVAKWVFERAWPSKITGPQPVAGSDTALEELTLVPESIQRVRP